MNHATPIVKDPVIDEKLALVSFHPDAKPHITIEQIVCAHCTNDRACVAICPAGNYTWDDRAQRMTVATESCFECGSCRIVCTDNAITWNWKTGGTGVMYAQG